MIYLQGKDINKNYFLRIESKYVKLKKAFNPVYRIQNDFPDVCWMSPDISIRDEPLPVHTVKWPCDYLNKLYARTLPIAYKVVEITADDTFKSWHDDMDFRWSTWEFTDYFEGREKNPLCCVLGPAFDIVGWVHCPWLCYIENESLKRFSLRLPKVYQMFVNVMKRSFSDFNLNDWFQ